MKSQILPIIRKNFKGEDIDWEEFFKERKEIKDKAKSGEICDTCENCQFLEEKEWDYINTEKVFTYIQLSHWLLCNSKCIYCGNHTEQKNKFRNNTSDTYNSVPIVKSLIEGNYINTDTKIDFAGGEPTIYTHFNELLKLFIDFGSKNIIVHSNAIKYSTEIERGLRKGALNLCISIDAGSKATHEKVKGVKSYNKVWHNVKKYAKAKNALKKNCFSLKYIIVPEINDSEEEIELWIKKSLKSGVNMLVLNADNDIFIKDMPDEKRKTILLKVIKLTEYFRKRMIEENINYWLEYNLRTAYILNNMDFPAF